MLEYLAISSIPCFILIILILGLKENLNIYELFIEGALEGLKIVYKIFPYILGITVCIGLFSSSNLLPTIFSPFKNILEKLNIPIDVLPLAFLRPLSGGAATGITIDIFNKYGPDSIVGKIASILMGATETTLYTITILFGATKAKCIRGTLLAGLLADITAIILSIFFVLNNIFM